jgi:ribonucleoside-diphosphate reductase alpha chain
MIPFDSLEAKLKNVEIAKFIQTRADAATIQLATMYGVPDALNSGGNSDSAPGRRNGTVSAIAPTTSSAFIIGQVSQSIEPFTANYYIKDLAKGKFSIRNHQLERLLDEKHKNTKTTWKSILSNGGSVQHLECLDEHEKAVFKTFEEISPREIIIQASQRQKYIDQGQSLNLWIHPKMPLRDLNAMIIEGWQLGLKSLYYQHSMNAAQEFSRKLLQCNSCEA